MSEEKSNMGESEKREYFRVDDVFPVKIRKVDKETAKRSVIHSATGLDIPDIASDETINPNLWKMLVDINSKLSLILDRLDYSFSERPENRVVNMSATGIRFTEDERIETGDEVEVTMFLPTTPPVEIMTYGTAVRVDDAGNGKYEIALHFTDMEDTVRDEIIQYLLNRQREIIRKKREYKGNDA